MNFALSEQQEMLRKSARDFLGKEYSDKRLKEIASDPAGCPPDLWNKIAELGWTALAVPENYGGIGDFLDLTVVLEEMGRAGLISSFFSSVVLGATLLIEAGSDAQKLDYLPALAEGKSIFTLALLEQSGYCSPAAIQAQALSQNNDYVIHGNKMFVTDANSADHIIVAARTGETATFDGGITLFIVDSTAAGLNRISLETIGGEKQSEVILNQVKVSRKNVLGDFGQGWKYIEKVIARAAIATCALMLGGAERVLELTVAYAQERNAFGHPIGAYQSIQHRCADMLSDIESARFATYQGAWKLNEGLYSAKEVAVAKAWVNQACRRVVTSAHQVHGAIGFTADHILHWYTRQTRAREMSFGDTNYHLNQFLKICKD